MSQFSQHSGVEHPIIGGPMYPCSNPELVAAISEAGALGIIQPLSLTYVHGYDFREGMHYMHRITKKPLGFNALIEKSSKKYQQRMSLWIDIALEEGVRFFITSLGKPDWVVERVHAVGGYVYHDVTERKWASIGVDCGVDGLICVNNHAGGHCGGLSSRQLYDECADLGLPLVCAGGIGDHDGLKSMLDMGYQACQLGTRFIASTECQVSDAYKQAIVRASASDIALTEKMTGVPVSIIKPERYAQERLKASGLLAWALASPRFKHLARMVLSLRSLMGLKKAIGANDQQSTYWQAGKSVAAVDSVKPVFEIVQDLVRQTKQ